MFLYVNFWLTFIISLGCDNMIYSFCLFYIVFGLLEDHLVMLLLNLMIGEMLWMLLIDLMVWYAILIPIFSLTSVQIVGFHFISSLKDCMLLLCCTCCFYLLCIFRWALLCITRFGPCSLESLLCSFLFLYIFREYISSSYQLYLWSCKKLQGLSI